MKSFIYLNVLNVLNPALALLDAGGAFYLLSRQARRSAAAREAAVLAPITGGSSPEAQTAADPVKNHIIREQDRRPAIPLQDIAGNCSQILGRDPHQLPARSRYPAPTFTHR